MKLLKELNKDFHYCSFEYFIIHSTNFYNDVSKLYNILHDYISHMLDMGFQCRRIPFLSTMAPPSILRDTEDGSERYNKLVLLLLIVNSNTIYYLINHFCLKNCSDMGENYADINWEGLSFSLTQTDYMHVMKCTKGEKFSQGSLIRYGNIEISPAAGIINYGQVKSAQYMFVKIPSER